MHIYIHIHIYIPLARLYIYIKRERDKIKFCVYKIQGYEANRFRQTYRLTEWFIEWFIEMHKLKTKPDTSIVILGESEVQAYFL